MSAKKCSLLILFFIATKLIAQDTIWYNKNWKTTLKHNEAAYYRPTPVKVNNLYHIKDYYKSGALQFECFSETNDTNLYKHGKEIYYFENGSVQGYGYFKNNLKQDSVVTFHENGNIKYIHLYKNNKLNGKGYFFYKSGTLFKEAYFVNDKFDGKYIEYYENGQYLGITNYSNNIINGKTYTYFNNGKKETESNYVNGKREGFCYEYNFKGQLIKECEYKNNKKTDTCFEINYIKNKPIKTKFIATEILNVDEATVDKTPATKNANVQIINLDEQKPLLRKHIEMDTSHSYNESISEVLILSKTFTADSLQIKNEKITEVFFNVHYCSDGIYILNEYNKYKVLENEIAIFYEKDEGEDISRQQLRVLLGPLIKSALRNKNMEVSTIVGICDGGIFDYNFPGLELYSKIEKELLK